MNMEENEKEEKEGRETKMKKSSVYNQEKIDIADWNEVNCSSFKKRSPELILLCRCFSKLEYF